jgi:hypothetical protein
VQRAAEQGGPAVLEQDVSQSAAERVIGPTWSTDQLSFITP